MNVLEYAEGTEKLIDPMKVGTVHHLQKKMRKLPVWIQRKIIIAASKKASKMGFIVEPYCFFLFYEIPDPVAVQFHLPDDFVPVKSSVFSNDTPKYYGIVNFFRIHTNVFWGSRSEFYIVAKNKKTGLTSWVMLDYISDTISYDEKHGLRSPNVEYAVNTTTCEGDFVAHYRSLDDGKSALSDGREIICHADLNHHKNRLLDKKLWIEGNTSIAYSRDVGGADGDLFSLTFMPEEMKQAWDIPLNDVKKATVPWYPEIFGGKLDKAACFPYAQHMLSDSPGTRTYYGNEDALRKAAEKVDFSKIKTL